MNFFLRFDGLPAAIEPAPRFRAEQRARRHGEALRASRSAAGPRALAGAASGGALLRGRARERRAAAVAGAWRRRLRRTSPTEGPPTRSPRAHSRVAADPGRSRHQSDPPSLAYSPRCPIPPLMLERHTTAAARLTASRGLRGRERPSQTGGRRRTRYSTTEADLQRARACRAAGGGRRRDVTRGHACGQQLNI